MRSHGGAESLRWTGFGPAAHATSAARYFEECLRGSEYWDVAPEAQTAANVPARLLAFLARADAAG